MREKTEGITVLYKGGRLPAWHALAPEKRRAYEQEHVDLMLNVAADHGLQRIEGFRLMAPQGAYERFWAMDFGDLAGAEAWIKAEMAPPYGHYGFYEYHLARGGLPEYCAAWAKGLPPLAPHQGDPHVIPALAVDCGSVVAVLFEKNDSGTDEPPGDAHIAAMESCCQEHGLLRLESFRLLAPQAAWQRVWLAEFPDIAGAEAWIQAEKDPAHGAGRERSFLLTRKWAPAYFAAWVKA